MPKRVSNFNIKEIVTRPCACNNGPYRDEVVFIERWYFREVTFIGGGICREVVFIERGLYREVTFIERWPL